MERHSEAYYRTKEELAIKARIVAEEPDHIGVYSTGERIAVALLLNRLDLLPSGYTHVVEAWDRLGKDWQQLVIDLHNEGWER
ncbi:MAG: hypothetical protein ACRC67_22665 [Inquilinus sp.]|uniref:hypothetical protein n=1 Tax=Inquilinus sp. TaxID=1932117 RepID=UPI003F2E6557